MTSNDFVEVVETLNEIMFENNPKLLDSFSDMFEYSTNGFWECIKFGNNIIWDSENDTREIDPETNNFEPFLPYIKKQFNEWAKSINWIRQLNMSGSIDTPYIKDFLPN
jgi:hypothetical protein